MCNRNLSVESSTRICALAAEATLAEYRVQRNDADLWAELGADDSVSEQRSQKRRKGRRANGKKRPGSQLNAGGGLGLDAHTTSSSERLAHNQQGMRGSEADARATLRGKSDRVGEHSWGCLCFIGHQLDLYAHGQLSQEETRNRNQRRFRRLLYGAKLHRHALHSSASSASGGSQTHLGGDSSTATTSSSGSRSGGSGGSPAASVFLSSQLSGGAPSSPRSASIARAHLSGSQSPRGATSLLAAQFSPRPTFARSPSLARTVSVYGRTPLSSSLSPSQATTATALGSSWTTQRAYTYTDVVRHRKALQRVCYVLALENCSTLLYFVPGTTSKLVQRLQPPPPPRTADHVPLPEFPPSGDSATAANTATTSGDKRTSKTTPGGAISSDAFVTAAGGSSSNSTSTASSSYSGRVPRRVTLRTGALVHVRLHLLRNADQHVTLCVQPTVLLGDLLAFLCDRDNWTLVDQRSSAGTTVRKGLM
jgi:hypothetical protein